MAGRLGGCLTSRGGIGRKTVNSLVEGKRGDVLRGFVEGTREGRNGKEAGRLTAQTVLQMAGGSAKPHGPSKGVLQTRSRKLMEEHRSIGLGMATGPLVAGGLNPRRKPVAGKFVKGQPRKRTTRGGSHPDDVSVGRGGLPATRKGRGRGDREGAACIDWENAFHLTRTRVGGCAHARERRRSVF